MGFAITESTAIDVIQPKTISDQVIQEKYEYAQNYAEQNNTSLPGQFAPEFQILDERLALTVTPCAGSDDVDVHSRQELQNSGLEYRIQSVFR